LRFYFKLTGIDNAVSVVKFIFSYVQEETDIFIWRLLGATYFTVG